MAPVQRKLEEKTRDILRTCVLFSGLPADACDDLASKAKIKSFKERETIFVMGAPGKSLMALLAGKVRISVSSPDGKEITLAMLQPGEIFGEIAVLDGRERTANAIAASDCRLAELERKDVLHFFDRQPGAWHSLVKVLCDRLRRTDQQLGELALLPLTSRLSMTLLRAAEMQQVEGRSLIQVHLSQREIGNLVGVSRESINKVMHHWQKAGLIMIKDQTIIITRPDLLERLSEDQ
jgi:CRP/FNR family transcriptional regulator, cyclic AMP receptor protein